MNQAGKIADAGSATSLLTRERQVEIARILLVAFVTGLYWREAVPRSVLVAGIAFGLYPLAKKGLSDLFRERKVGTEIFVTAATIIALAGGEYIAAAVLMTIILIAEFIADFNTDRARASIKALVGATPRTALIRADGGERTVPVEEVRPGMIVLARAGDKLPVDGTVVAGAAAINEASITGESLPVEKVSGGSVLAGTVVESGAIDVRTDKVGADTVFARIVSLVEDAESEQAPVQRLADRVAAWLLPVVFVFLLTVYLITHDIRKIVTLLIFTSPAELGLATPMVMIAAVARAARNGILVKGGLYLELLSKVDTIVFDKTGTLTRGEPRVVAVHAGAGIREEDLLRCAAAADRRSSHPLAQAVVKAAQERGIEIPEVENFQTVHGRGVIGTIDGAEVLVGNEALLADHKIGIPASAGSVEGTAVCVAIAGTFAGFLEISDEVRPNARQALERLRASGVREFVMLTGDSPGTAAAVARELGIASVKAQLLPQDKVNAIEELRREGRIVAMVGDGVNDAPALARADVGIAMGARGTQAAIEAADIALMTDDLGKIVVARLLAQYAYRTIQQNLLFGVGVVHVLGITAALAGWIGPIQAAMLHLGPDVLVFLNSVKLLRVRIEGAK